MISWEIISQSEQKGKSASIEREVLIFCDLFIYCKREESCV